MKRVLMILAATFMVASVYGQNLRSEDGERVLPQAQDWSIGVDANPFFSYLKGLIGQGNDATTPAFNQLLSNQMITGKYFVEEDMALRASLRVGVRANNVTNKVADRTLTGTVPVFPATTPTVENEYRRTGLTLGLSLGAEKRRGNTRLQGYYGGEVGFLVSGNREEFNYGNALNVSTTKGVSIDPSDEFFTAPTISANNLVNDSYGNAARVTERDFGRTFQLGVRAFIGAEYFIFPKISIGGEFGWGLGFQSTRGAERITESINNSGTPTAQYGLQTTGAGKTNGFVLDTDNANSLFGPAGSLRLNLYF